MQIIGNGIFLSYFALNSFLQVIKDRPRARAEVEIHTKVMDHPNIVQLYQVFCNELKFPGESEPTGKLILILEKMAVSFNLLRVKNWPET